MKKVMGYGLWARGFTLIELMIALTIIAVVFGVIITSSAAIQKSARDTQRKSDLANIQAALEQYHADAGFYPLPFALGVPSPLKNPVTGKSYLNQVPKDPSTGNNYLYETYELPLGSYTTCTSGSCVYYCLYSDLENNPPASTPATPCTFSGTNDYYVASP